MADVVQFGRDTVLGTAVKEKDLGVTVSVDTRKKANYTSV